MSSQVMVKARSKGGWDYVRTKNIKSSPQWEVSLGSTEVYLQRHNSKLFKIQQIDAENF